MSEDLNPFAGGGGPPAASFNSVGDSVEGKVVKVEYQLDIDLVTQEPKTFSDGKPRSVVVVTLKVANGDEVRDFVKGRAISEFRTKVYAAQGPGTSPVPGASYKRTFTGENPPAKPGLNPEKLYEITYTPPDMRELV